MNKREFLGAATMAGMLPATANAVSSQRGPTLLTVTGAIPRSNRAPFDPVLDQMMHKQQVSFRHAWVFNDAALMQLAPVTIRPTLEYDGKPHTLRGPLLLDVLAHAGARVSDASKLVLRAVDGYNVEVSGKAAREQRFIVATDIDGGAMPLGGLGPLWAVYDADRVPQMAALPLAQRFQKCPWALYHVDVQG